MQILDNRLKEIRRKSDLKQCTDTLWLVVIMKILTATPPSNHVHVLVFLTTDVVIYTLPPFLKIDFCRAQPQVQLQLWLRLVLVSIPPIHPLTHPPPVRTSSEHLT